MADQGTGGQALSERVRVLDSDHDVVLESVPCSVKGLAPSYQMGKGNLSCGPENQGSDRDARDVQWAGNRSKLPKTQAVAAVGRVTWEA